MPQTSFCSVSKIFEEYKKLRVYGKRGELWCLAWDNPGTVLQKLKWIKWLANIGRTESVLTLHWENIEAGAQK